MAGNCHLQAAWAAGKRTATEATLSQQGSGAHTLSAQAEASAAAPSGLFADDLHAGLFCRAPPETEALGAFPP
jgi:hypothetical protein